ncbi:uncharacterized protein LOC129220539 [Uloborus diversus]|uniref:uncharacterized protein LOC129220539 n=1 Tax=Uloborus diversus TaxID=327109 RepID=UPI00240A4D90|nr:uncharacterized protein LOC129220539 [Uloborus diversus]
MARNHEKHYGRLNRLFLLKEKEEFEKANPTRPKLDLLNTPEEIQKWIPSIKKDIDFYLKKSKVTCYSDQQIEDCNLKIVQLEKEFKAFIRKIKKLTPGVLDVIPWTSRPYKRKKLDCLEEAEPQKEFTPIATPLLNETKETEKRLEILDSPSMNEPLTFNQPGAPNSNSKPFNSSESTNANSSGLGSNVEALSAQYIEENMSFNGMYPLGDSILCQKYNEASSMCFKSNDVVPSLQRDLKSVHCDLIHCDDSSVNTTEDSLCEKAGNLKKRLCKITPSNQDFSNGDYSLSGQERDILNGEKSDSEFKKQFSHSRTNTGLQTHCASNDKISVSSNQSSLKLVDYNCSDSDSCSE